MILADFFTPTVIKWESYDESVWDKITDHYQLINELGHGSFGFVFNARDKKTNEIIALKQIKKSQVEKEVMENEINIMNRLPKHQNICGYYGYYEDKDYLWIALQKCGNTSVRTMFDKIKENEDDARYIFKQVVSAVMAMHNSGMYHRDLKPNNIQLTVPLMKVELIDFGESIFSNAPTRDFTGAEGYSTPESESGKLYKPSLMDVWVLGVTLFRMRFDIKPFGRGWDKTYKEKVINLDYSFPEPTSDSFRDLITNMLQKEDKRLTLEQVSRHPWMTFDD